MDITVGSTFVGSYICSFVWCSIFLFSLNISWQVFFLFYSIFYLAILLTHYLNILVFLLLGRWEPLIVVDLPGFWKGLNSTSPLSSSLECLLTSNIWNVIDRLSYYKLNIAPYRDLKMIKILAILFSYFQMSPISTNLITWGWEWGVKVEIEGFQMSWLW